MALERVDCDVASCSFHNIVVKNYFIVIAREHKHESHHKIGLGNIHLSERLWPLKNIV